MHQQSKLPSEAQHGRSRRGRSLPRTKVNMLALQRASVAVAAVVGGGTMVTDSPEHLIERWWAPAAAVCNFCRLVSPSDRHLTWRADVCECHMVQVATACAARLHRLRQSNALSARHEHRQRVCEGEAGNKLISRWRGVGKRCGRRARWGNETHRRLRECRRRLGRFRLGRRVRRPVVGDPTTRSRRAHHGMMHTRVTSSWGCMRVCTKLGQGVLWRVSTSLVRHPRVHPRQAPAGRKRLRGGMACARGRSVGPWRVGSDSYG